MDRLVKEPEQADLERAIQESLTAQNGGMAELASAEDPIPVEPAPVGDAGETGSTSMGPVSTGLLDRLRNLSPA